MIKIKLCGLKRMCDIEYVNEFEPEYIGFVFVPERKRCITPKEACRLRKALRPEITPVGVFVNERPETIASLWKLGVIDMVQLHGQEDEHDILELRKLTECKIIQAFCIKSEEDIAKANASTADYVLLDSGCGSGELWDWKLLEKIERPFFLAGGLTSENVSKMRNVPHLFGVDASSSLEINGVKDRRKIQAFVEAVRKD